MPLYFTRIVLGSALLVLSGLYSCQRLRLGNTSLRLEGNIEVLLHNKDRSQAGNIVLEGFVYSRDTQQYLRGAVITLQDSIDRYTDDKGYFYYQGPPGKYKIRCKFSEHHQLDLSSVKARENERILLFFSLGSSTLY